MRSITESAEWVRYFQDNAQHQRTIPWELGAGITADELRAIADSLRGWQLGETSDGSHLRAVAHEYAAQAGDPDFVEAVELFILEEQRHGDLLGRFLDLAGVERARSDWGDTLFRGLRYALRTMEVWVTPVMMVETHALVYYHAVREATQSAVLRGICEQILADEVAHIHFQCQRLANIHSRRARPLLLATMAVHRLLFAAITLAIWFGHRRTLRAGGYRFSHFWRSAWSRMDYAWRIIALQIYLLRDDLPDLACPAVHVPDALGKTPGCTA